MSFRRFTKLPLALALLTAAGGLAAYPGMPERVPLHWGINGIDRWGTKSLGVVLFAPLMIVALWALMLVAPRFDPKGRNVELSPHAYGILADAIACFFAFMQVVLIASAYNPGLATGRIISAGVGVLFVLLGNWLPRVPPNWVAGVRLPWTLSDDVVWKRTNRLGGLLFVASGVILTLGAFVLPEAGNVLLVLAATLVIVPVCVVYSYILYRQRHPREPVAE
jgi:uncharacterized membrane protein